LDQEREKCEGFWAEPVAEAEEEPGEKPLIPREGEEDGAKEGHKKGFGVGFAYRTDGE
jgi:hypothetical protein